MPIVSKAQNRFFRWTDAHPDEAAREGVKPKVTKDFLASEHGKKLTNLPERVQHKAHGGAVKAARIFKW